MNEIPTVSHMTHTIFWFLNNENVDRKKCAECRPTIVR